MKNIFSGSTNETIKTFIDLQTTKWFGIGSIFCICVGILFSWAIYIMLK